MNTASTSASSRGGVSVKAKLLAVFYTLCVLMMTLALVVWVSLDRTQSTLQTLNEEYTQGISEAVALLAAIEQGELQQMLAADWDVLAGQQEIMRLKHQALSTGEASALQKELLAYIDQSQQRVSNQHELATLDAAAGKSIVLVVTVVIVFAALAGVLVVRELATDLAVVTNAVSGLAQGDDSHKSLTIKRLDEIGMLSGAFNVFKQNAQQLRQASDSLAAQSRLQGTIFENINDGLSVFDKDGRLIKWNNHYTTMFSFQPDELYEGLTLSEVRRLLEREPHENRGLDGKRLDIIDVNSLRMSEDQRFQRFYQDGRVIEFRSRPMPQGGFVTLYTDLTEAKALEAKYQHSSKMETIGQLVGGIAHDFNNLLTAMVGNLEFLEAKVAHGSDQHNLVFKAMASAERGVNLTQRLLAFACRQHLSPEIIKLDETILGMLDLVEYSIGKDISLQLSLHAGERQVFLDPGQLENALLNLCINASNAMPQGGTLHIATRVDQYDELQVQVTDTGQGIASDLLSKIFEPFFSTHTSPNSTGLGLSMVYGFVKQSGGDVRVHSESGKGSRFTLCLPQAAKGQLQVKHVNASLNQSRDTDIDVLKGKRILVVEDDYAIKELVQRVLLTHGCDCSVLGDAVDALALIEYSNHWDLILSDVDLPMGVSGIEFEQRLRAQDIRTPLVLMSALPREVLQGKYGEEFNKPIFAKPFRQGQLLQRLAQELS